MNTDCKKCGGSGNPTYHNCIEQCSGRFNSMNGEHLHFVCENCGYDWVTKTKDVLDAEMAENNHESEDSSKPFRLPLIRWSSIPDERRVLDDPLDSPPKNRCEAASRETRNFGKYHRCGNKKASRSDFCGTHKRSLREAGEITWTVEEERIQKGIWKGNQTVESGS